MNIITINLNDLKNEISSYQTSNKKDPIILVNKDTYNFLKDKDDTLDFIFIPNEEEIALIYNCRLAIAPWVPFGEALIR